MEENKQIEKKLSYEQLEQAAAILQQKLLQAEAKIQSINFTAVRLDYLFKVLDKSTHFNKEFIDKCSEEIVSLMTIENEELAEEETTK